MRQLDGEPRLAAAAGAEHRDEAVRQHLAAQARALHVGAEDAREVGRQRGVANVGRARGGSRRRRGWGAGNAGDDQAVMQGDEAGALVVDPLIVEARQQFAAVERTRFGDAAGAGVALEVRHVAGQAAGHDAHADAVSLQHRRHRAAHGFEQALEREQRLAQAIPPGVERHAGPQQLDQFFACVGTRRPQRQARQQGGDGATGQARELLLPVTQNQAAEEPELPARVHSTRAGRGNTRRGWGGRVHQGTVRVGSATILGSPSWRCDPASGW